MEWSHKGAAKGGDGLEKEVILGNLTEGLESLTYHSITFRLRA